MEKTFFDIRRQASNVYIIRFRGGVVVIFRPLKWSDYKALVSLQLFPSFESFSMGLQDDLFRECVVDCNLEGWRENIDNMSAGVVDAVSKAIVFVSGVESTEEMITSVESARYMYGIADSQISTVLAMTLNIGHEELNNMEWPDILQRLVQAENILAGNIPAAPFHVDGKKPTIDFTKDNKEHEEELGRPKDPQRDMFPEYPGPQKKTPKPVKKTEHNINFNEENEEDFPS